MGSSLNCGHGKGSAIIEKPAVPLPRVVGMYWRLPCRILYQKSISNTEAIGILGLRCMHAARCDALDPRDPLTGIVPASIRIQIARIQRSGVHVKACESLSVETAARSAALNA